jgi:hypothetical protein
MLGAHPGPKFTGSSVSRDGLFFFAARSLARALRVVVLRAMGLPLLIQA